MGPLVEAGYLVRLRDEDDRRVVKVRLSEQAQESADQILAARRAQVETALEGMDQDARAHFLEGLSRLAAAIEEDVGAPPSGQQRLMGLLGPPGRAKEQAG